MEKLLNFIKENKSEYSITSDSTTAEKLRHKAFLHEKTDKEWLELEDEIKQYVASGPSESEMDILYEFGEMVSMSCSAIRKREEHHDDID